MPAILKLSEMTCSNCRHNSYPYANCDGCSQQQDNAEDEGNWEPVPSEYTEV